MLDMHIFKDTLYIITLVSCTFLTGFSQRGNVALQEELTYSRQINQTQLFEVNPIKGEEIENLRTGFSTTYSDSPLFKITPSELSDLVSNKENSLDIKTPVEGFSELNNYRGLESEITMNLTRSETQQANFQVSIDCECVSEEVTQTFTVGSGANDVEESNTGAMGLTSGDLDLFMDDDDAATTYKIGLRYQNLPLSVNTSVSSAYLKFQVDEVSTGSSSFNIQIESTSNSAAFTTANSNLSNRVFLNTSTSWQSVPAWNVFGASGSSQTSPDISELLNAVIEQSGTVANNAMTLMITGTGIRTAVSFDGNNTGVELIMTYTDSTDCPDTDNDTVPDLCDVCPGGDDLVDSDDDGIPDFCDSDQDDQCNDSDVNILTTIEGDLKFDGACYGVILESENGSCFKITIGNGGQLKSTPVNCDN